MNNVFKNNVFLEDTPKDGKHVVNKKYVDETVESLLDDTSIRSDKTWSSEKISKINVTDAKKVDEKPTYSAGTITYIKDGTSYDTTNDKQWFYYLENGSLKQTIFIEGEELTIDGASVDFDEYIKKTSIATTIDSTCTNVQVIGAKAVYDNCIKNNNIKTYTLLSQLGLSEGCSVGDIFNAMPNGSIAHMNVNNAGNIVDLPVSTWGILIIEKLNIGRFNIVFKMSLSGIIAINEMYIGQLQGSDGSGITWKRVCATNVADISTKQLVLGSTSIFSEGVITYCVNNGWCNFTISGLTSALGSSVELSSSAFPTPANGLITVPLIDDLSGTTVGMFYIDKNYGSLPRCHIYKTGLRAFATLTYKVAES